MTRLIGEPSDKRDISNHEYRVRQLERRPAPEGGGGGLAVYEIKVFEDPVTVIVGDGRFWWPIPDDLDAAEIVYADAGISTVSSSGPVEVQIAHQIGGSGGLTDILSTKIAIAAGNKNATPGAVSGGAWAVANGDWLRIDVDAAGVDAKGLAVLVGLTPSPLGSVTIQGAQGPAGGVTTWEGAWSGATTYQTGDSVSHNGTSYVARQGSTNVEPGVTAGWENYWQILSAAQSITEIAVPISGSGYVIEPGIKTRMPVYFSGTIVEATLLADAAGSTIVDIWKDTYGNYPPTDADSITAAAPLTLSGAIKTTDTTLTGWTTAIASGDTLIYNVDSCTGIRDLTVGLKVRRT